jgi:hypothetical protein
MHAIAVNILGRVATEIACSCGFNGRVRLGVALATPSKCTVVVLRVRARAAGTVE